MKIQNPKFNASKELVSFDGLMMDGNKAVMSDPKTLELVNQVRALPRVSKYTGSAAPRVVIDGKEYALAFKFFTDEEKATYKSYRGDHSNSGSGGSSKIPEAVLEELMKPEIFKTLSKESQAFLESQKREDPKIVKAIKALVALGMSEEQAKKIVESQNK